MSYINMNGVIVDSVRHFCRFKLILSARLHAWILKFAYCLVRKFSSRPTSVVLTVGAPLSTFSYPRIWHLSRLWLVHVPSRAASFWPPRFSCVSFSSLLASPAIFQALVTSNSTVHPSLPLGLLGHWSVHLDTFELFHAERSFLYWRGWDIIQ